MQMCKNLWSGSTEGRITAALHQLNSRKADIYMKMWWIICLHEDWDRHMMTTLKGYEMIHAAAAMSNT